MRDRLRRVGAVIAAASLWTALDAAATRSAADEAITIRATPFALGAPPEPGAVLELVAGFVLDSDDERFGGLSGVALSEGGALFVGDRAVWVEMALERDVSGVLSGVGAARLGPLLDRQGRALRGRGGDAESLTRDLGGDLLVGYEHQHRIDRASSLDAPARDGFPAPAGVGFARNGGLEALALRADGAVLAIAEDPIAGGDEDLIYGWALRAGAPAAAFTIPRLDGFAVTGGDIGPDGALYVLERFFSFATGPRMRIRRFAPDAVAALGGPDAEAAALDAGEILIRLDAATGVDNMEGLAVEAGGDGRPLITVISDDNFNLLQRTLLLQFRPAAR